MMVTDCVSLSQPPPCAFHPTNGALAFAAPRLASAASGDKHSPWHDAHVAVRCAGAPQNHFGGVTSHTLPFTVHRSGGSGCGTTLALDEPGISCIKSPCVATTRCPASPPLAVDNAARMRRARDDSVSMTGPRGGA